MARHLAGGADEAAAVADAFQIEGDDFRVGVGGHGGQRVRLAHVDLVAEADEMGEAEPLAARPVDDGGANGPGVGDEGDVARRRPRWRQEGSVQRQVGVDEADAVGADEPDAVLAGHAQALLFQPRPFRPRLAEAAGGDDGGADAAAADVGQRAGHVGRGHDEHRQIDRVGHVGQGGVEGALQQAAAARVDEVDRAGVAALGQVAGHAEAELGRGRGRADDGDAGGVEKGYECGIGWLAHDP